MRNLLGLITLGTLALTFAACSEPPPKPIAVDPSILCNATDTTVTITGYDFRQTPAIALTAAGGQPIPVAPADVTFVDDQHVTFIARATLGLVTNSLYDLVMTNPSGGVGTLPMAFFVAPPPSVASLMPSALCDTMATTVTITGMSFRDDPARGPITVTIGTPTPTVLTETSGAVSYVSDTTLTVNLPAGLPDGTWSVTVQDEDGCGATLANAITVAAPPTITAVSDMAGTPPTFTITGTGFTAATTVTISLAGGTPIPVTPTSVTATSITAAVPAGIMAGTYTVTVANGPCTATAMIGLPPIAVTQVINPFGCNTQATPVTIAGAGFISTPSAKLLAAGGAGGDLALVNTAFVSSTKLSSSVPAGGKIGGPYDLEVTNPDGTHATESMAFTITKLCPPIIDNVTPSSVPHDYNTGAAGSSAIVITGQNFLAGATVVLVNSAGMEVMFPNASVTVNNANQITLNFNASTSNLTDGVYLVRVKESDTAAPTGSGATMYGDYSLFIVTNPSGKFQAATKTTPLPNVRRGLGVVGGQNNAAARYLYAIGGDAGTMTPAPVADGYVATLDPFGHVGDLGWLRLRKRAATPASADSFNDLPSARTGVGIAQTNRWVYLVGGTTALSSGAAPTPAASGPLDSVLRAHILSADDAPAVTSATASAGGSLAAGAYYYKVSMLLTASTPGYGASAAETVASDEQVVTVSAGGKVQLDFGKSATSTVAGGNIAGYRIYRSPMANLATESEVFIADVITTSGTAMFIDDGTMTPGGAHPLPAGMLSEWESAGTLKIPRAYAAVKLASPPASSAVNLYAIGGWSGATGGGAEKTWEFATVNGDGTLGAFGPSISLNGATNCTVENCLKAARWALYADTVTAPASVTAPATPWMLVGTGTLMGSDPIDERGAINADGSLGSLVTTGLAWAAVPNGAGGAFTTTSNTYGAIGFYSNGNISISDGYSGAMVSSKEEFGQEACTTVVTNVCQPGSDFTQTGKSASTLMISPAVAFSGYTLTSGYLFVVGGSSDGTNAVTNVDQAAQ